MQGQACSAWWAVGTGLRGVQRFHGGGWLERALVRVRGPTPAACPALLPCPQGLDWSFLPWLKANTRLPVLLKARSMLPRDAQQRGPGSESAGSRPVARC